MPHLSQVADTNSIRDAGDPFTNPFFLVLSGLATIGFLWIFLTLMRVARGVGEVIVLIIFGVLAVAGIILAFQAHQRYQHLSTSTVVGRLPPPGIWTGRPWKDCNEIDRSQEMAGYPARRTGYPAGRNGGSCCRCLRWRRELVQLRTREGGGYRIGTTAQRRSSARFGLHGRPGGCLLESH
jgi:hypothetical protein